MRALFTFVGGAGHLDPLLPIARAVRAAGHEVAVAGSSGQLARIAGEGFTALPTSPPRPPTARAVAAERTPLAPVRAHDSEVEFAENFADKATRRHVVAVAEHLTTWRPDVVVRDETDFGTSIATERVGLPCAPVLVLAAGTLARPDLVTPRLEAIRHELGLAADPGRATLSRDLVLSPFPPSFRDPSVPLPPTALSYRPRTLAPEGHGRLVYVTLGTVFNLESGDLFERLLAGLARVPADVLVTIGRDLEPDALGPHAANVRVEQYVAQAEVLPRCDLVVSHGGSGSLMGALEHGLPSVLLPLGADQPHNAERATELGFAAALDAASATPADIEHAVTAMLADPGARAAALAMKAEIDALPGPEATVPRLEALVAP